MAEAREPVAAAPLLSLSPSLSPTSTVDEKAHEIGEKEAC